jgi:hypothetical protein
MHLCERSHLFCVRAILIAGDKSQFELTGAKVNLPHKTGKGRSGITGHNQNQKLCYQLSLNFVFVSLCLFISFSSTQRGKSQNVPPLISGLNTYWDGV